MTLDNEQQKRFLLEMFKQVNFPGEVLDLAYATKKAVAGAIVTETVAKQQAVYDAKADTQ